ncbi:MAG: hypothetical protein ABIX28_06400 [Vicinamibacterales bacterium]
MNFLLHRYLAVRDLRDPLAGIGAMLPDLWRMADRRVRALRLEPGGAVAAPEPGGAAASSELLAVLRGIEHHLEVDRWFHGADVFAEGERLAVERIRATGLATPKLALFGHIAWELCLDGALIRRDGLPRTLRDLADGFAAADQGPARAAAARHHFDRHGRPSADRDAFDDGLRQLFAEISRGPWIAGYQDGAGIAQRIDGVRRRLGFARLTTDERTRFGAALETLTPDADAGLAAIDALGRTRSDQ